MSGRRRISPLQAALLVLTGVGAMVVSVLAAEPPAERDGYYYWPSSAGRVIFHHEGHADKVDECTSCHHEVKQGEEEPASCRTCHAAEQPSRERLLSCKECHEFTLEEYADDDEVEHEELVEWHGTGKCDMCHMARDITQAYHDQCTRCHEEVDRERFLDPDGAAKCGWCHLR